jgi:ATP-dependent Clp protease ATP-binding subunit ClpC
MPPTYPKLGRFHPLALNGAIRKGIMETRPNEPDLPAVRKLAEQLAKGRRETATTAHLLAALASGTDAAADLLLERNLDAERLLRAARASVDDAAADPLRRAIDQARDVSRRMGSRDARGVHLLMALLSDRGSAGYRALDQCGVDLNRLRVAAMNVGLGLLGRRRIVTRRDSNHRARQEWASQPPRGQTVPLLPPKPRVPPRGAEPPPPEAQACDPLPAPPPSLAEPERAVTPPPRRRRTPETPASRFELDRKRFPTLVALGQNLTLAAERGELDPVIGRDLEVEQALDVLAKRHGNNPCLVGAAGVGKTSVVRGLAQRIVAKEDVGSLDDRILVEIPVAELVAGTGVRGALAQRLGALRKEVAAAEGRVVLFFDEIHLLFSGDGADEMSGELKVALARGDLPCIGATTHEEYRKVIEADPALARRFSTVEVVELGSEDTYLVLDALAPALAAHHRVTYREEALAASIAWSVRYLPARALPDKAIGIVDLAGARTRRRGGQEVDPEAIAEVIAEMADMPIERLLETDGDRMLRLEELLADRVVGHEAELRRIARILRRNAVGLGAHRPIGTFLLLGPTGVGKTETAKAVAETLFFDENAMTRLDLSEYGEAHATSRLIGAPPGYVGHDAGGQLTEAVRRRPYQVILLDEVEKAHPEVLETFLQVFDEGRLTDGRGRLVDFRNTVIFITSNLGADRVQAVSRRRVGFARGEGVERQEVASAVVDAARAALAPELYNRIDEVLVFTPLARDDVRRIAERMLAGVGRALEVQRGIGLAIGDDVVEFLLDAGGYEPALGARPMKRTIARLVEAPLAERILRGELSEGDVAVLSVRDGAVCIVAPSEQAQPAAE